MFSLLKKSHSCITPWATIRKYNFASSNQIFPQSLKKFWPPWPRYFDKFSGDKASNKFKEELFKDFDATVYTNKDKDTLIIESSKTEEEVKGAVHLQEEFLQNDGINIKTIEKTMERPQDEAVDQSVGGKKKLRFRHPSKHKAPDVKQNSKVESENYEALFKENNKKIEEENFKKYFETPKINNDSLKEEVIKKEEDKKTQSILDSRNSFFDKYDSSKPTWNVDKGYEKQKSNNIKTEVQSPDSNPKSAPTSNYKPEKDNKIESKVNVAKPADTDTNTTSSLKSAGKSTASSTKNNDSTKGNENITANPEPLVDAPFGKEVDALANALNFIKSNLDCSKNWNYKVFVVDGENSKPFVKSFSNGNIYLSATLFDLFKTTDEIIFVLIHELAHIDLRHELRLRATVSLFKIFLSVVMSNKHARTKSLREISATKFHYATKSKDLKADSIALNGLEALQYNKYAGIDFLNRLYDQYLKEKDELILNEANEAELSKFENDWFYVSSHPSLEDRIVAMKNLKQNSEYKVSESYLKKKAVIDERLEDSIIYNI